MQHQYTSASMLEGAWLSEESPPRVYCRWWWERNELALHVMCGTVSRSWSPPLVNPEIERRLLEDFPEIAYDVALRL